MWNLLESFSDIDNGLIIFFMFFGVMLAIFHTVLLSGLYNLKFPRWLFFILNPLLIGGGFVLYKPLGGGIFLGMFASVFVLEIIGIAIRNIIDSVKSVRVGVKKEGATYLGKAFLSFAALAAFWVAFLYFGFIAFFVMFGIAVLGMIFVPTTRSRFLKLQSILPTSTVRSLAMGLVELSGRVQPIKPVTAPMNSKKCVAYRYTVSEVSTDKEGRKSYTLIEEQKECHDFYLEDATGKVLVKAEDLEFHWLPEDEKRESGSMRYAQDVLYINTEVLLIGNANTENNQPVIAKDLAHSVFMLAPAASVTKWNVFSPLRRSFIACLLMIALVCAGVLMMLNIEMVDNQLIISWKNSTNLEVNKQLDR